MVADAGNSKCAGRSGGVEAVITVLRRKNAADSLLEAACRALKVTVSSSSDLGMWLLTAWLSRILAGGMLKL